MVNDFFEKILSLNAKDKERSQAPNQEFFRTREFFFAVRAIYKYLIYSTSKKGKISGLFLLKILKNSILDDKFNP